MPGIHDILNTGLRALIAIWSLNTGLWSGLDSLNTFHVVIIFTDFSLVTIRIDFAWHCFYFAKTQCAILVRRDESGPLLQVWFHPWQGSPPVSRKKVSLIPTQIKSTTWRNLLKIMRLRDLYSDNDCISTVSPATIRNIDMWQLAVNFQLILGSMRFRKIAPGPRPRHASSLSLVKVAVAQASGAGMSLSKAGPSSQPNHDFPEVTPVTASSPGHHTGRDKARYSRGQIHTWPAVDYADQPCVIHDNLWRDQISVSHPSRPKVRRLLHPSVFHNLSFIFIQPRSGPGALPRGRDHFQ